MNGELCEFDLGPEARARREAMLPGLLAAVRTRRRRRRAVQATVAIALVAVATLFAWTAQDRAVTPPAPPSRMAAWTVVGNDPTALPRCRVATVVRAEWFVDDRGLRGLLAASGRPAGLVRLGSRVAVSPAAVDPWPSGAEFEE